MELYAVFNSDGDECKSLLGVTGDIDQAQQFQAHVSGLLKRFYEEHLETEWDGKIEIEPVHLGCFKMPPEAEIVIEEAPPIEEEMSEEVVKDPDFIDGGNDDHLG